MHYGDDLPQNSLSPQEREYFLTLFLLIKYPYKESLSLLRVIAFFPRELLLELLKYANEFNALSALSPSYSI